MSATIEAKQVAVAAPEAINDVVAPAEPETKVELETAEAPAAPEVVAAAPTAEPVEDAVKQPTSTHAETGTVHTDAEPATQIDGTSAAAAETSEETPKPADEDKPTEAKKEEKKVATKEKVEKTKAEGKGFFAKFFGSKDRSPKKDKKVKTPKTEKTDPTPAAESAPAETTAPAAEVAELPASESKPEITAVAAAEPAAVAPAEAPIAVPAVAVTEPEAVKETETVPAAVTEETAAPAVAEMAPAPVEEKKEENPRAIKTSRRLSTRFISGLKNLGKKDHPSPKEEKTKEAAEAQPTAEEAVPTHVTEEAPQLEKPIATEPLKIDEAKTSSAPPAAATVSATA